MSPRPHQPLTPLSVVVALVTLFFLGAIGSAQLSNFFREVGRRNVCSNNLRQLALALVNYDTVKNVYPGYHTALVSKTDGKTYSRPLLCSIFPQLERNDLYELYSAENHAKDELEGTYLGMMVCPSAESDTKTGPVMHYLFNTGMPDAKSEKFPPDWRQNGIFQDNYSSKQTNGGAYVITHDGATNTVLLSERAEAGRWTATAENEVGFVWSPRFKSEPWAKINSVAAKTKNASGDAKGGTKTSASDKEAKKQALEKQWGLARPSSKHPKVVNVAFCDAHVRPLGETIDYIVYAQLMTPYGAKARYPGTEDDVEKEFRDYELKEKDLD